VPVSHDRNLFVDPRERSVVTNVGGDCLHMRPNIRSFVSVAFDASLLQKQGG
jgi:hypothetical protein